MFNYIVSRLLQGILVIFLISVVTFIIMRMMPGDPVRLLLGEGSIKLSTEQIEAIRAKWGLDRPYHEQYLIWATGMLRGDFGESLIRRGVPVGDMIWEAMPVTGYLNIMAIAVALVLSIPAGIIAAVHRNSIFDYLLTLGSTAGAALPNFWVALVSIIVFALWLRWVPPFGLKEWDGYILPVAVLALGEMAIFARVMRGATIEVLSQDYVRTATAKGLSHQMVILRHAVRNALLPVVTVIGFRIAFLFSGTIIIENIFAIPGIGRLFIDSVFRIDYQVVQSIVVILAVLVVVANLLTDLLYAFVDPRLRTQGR
ncbi:MAG: ABC transporter permease [Caldilineaceae bacterium]|nr:ABC transporter permease [Caldilineaceae bacterium]